MNNNIFRLCIENYLTIENATLDLTPGVTGLCGKNAQGKTNFLKALSGLLDGTHDIEKIMDGKKRSEIRLELTDGDDVISSVSRIQTLKGSRLEGGGPAGQTPREWLSELLDELAINPIRLISEDPVKYLKKHLPIKANQSDIPKNQSVDSPFDIDANAFSECEKQVQYYKSLREATFRDLRNAKGIVSELLANLPQLPEKPDFTKDDLETEADTIKSKISNAELIKEQRDKLLSKHNAVDSKRVAILKNIEELSIKLSELELRPKQFDEMYQRELADLKRKYDDKHGKNKHEVELVKQKISFQQEAGTLYKCEMMDISKEIEKNVIVDVSELKANLDRCRSKYQSLQRYVEIEKQHKQIEEKQARVQSLEIVHKQEDTLCKYFQYELPKILINRSNLPVEGLEFRDEIIYVNDRNIGLLSETERNLVAIKLAIALAKAKGHIAVALDGVEVMDEEHRKEFLEIIKKAGIRVLYTRVGKPENEYEKEIVKNGN